ncbi:polymer-forming cytoskeletal protein [Bacteroidia bacterium]|jgi:cytoskeletal protein CcmA (bactofilin family)|nr:polymer-forming cytoskeletal protein [Bacteroidia bacterium]
MLGQKDRNTPASTNTINVISEGTVIKGDIHSSGDLRIDGEVKGDVTTDGKCVVGINGLITGCIKAKDCDISGKTQGEVNISNLLLIKSTGKVNGDIFTSKMVLENGGEYNGTCSMGNSISMKKEVIQTELKDGLQAKG